MTGRRRRAQRSYSLLLNSNLVERCKAVGRLSGVVEGEVADLLEADVS
jgi:hypothetical protein